MTCAVSLDLTPHPPLPQGEGEPECSRLRLPQDDGIHLPGACDGRYAGWGSGTFWSRT